MLASGETIQSQYAASPAIRAIAESFRITIAPDADIELFYKSIFDLESAQGIGLDIWGRILGLGRSIKYETDEECFGFYTEIPVDESDPSSYAADFEPFDQAPFYPEKTITATNTLGDEAYRRFLFWKALANISTADMASLNSLVYLLFGKRLVCYEWGVMNLELYIFEAIQPFERAILANYGSMCRGAAVGLNWVEIALPSFGFLESDYEPFDCAPFWQTEDAGAIAENPALGFYETDYEPFDIAPFWQTGA